MARRKKNHEQYDDVILGPDAEQRRREDRELLVKLTDEQLQQKRLDLSDLARARVGMEAELKEVTAPLRDDLRDNKKAITKLAEVITSGCELAMVQCEEERVFAQNKIIVRRLDTNEIVETRAMQGEERQLEIDTAPIVYDDDGVILQSLQDGAP